VRAAFGSFYETINADIIQNTSQPFNDTFTINTPFSLADPLRGQAQPPLFVNFTNPLFVGTQQVFNADPGLRTPYVEQLNLNVQRQIFKDLTLQVGYMGASCSRLATIRRCRRALIQTITLCRYR